MKYTLPKMANTQLLRVSLCGGKRDGWQTEKAVATYIPRIIKISASLFLSWMFKLDPEREEAFEIKLRTFVGHCVLQTIPEA